MATTSTPEAYTQREVGAYNLNLQEIKFYERGNFIPFDTLQHLDFSFIKNESADSDTSDG